MRSRDREAASIATILLAAAERIERDGWCQGDRAIGSRRCASQAITDAVAFGDADVLYGAREAFKRHVRAGDIPAWNDTPGRTVDEVLAALRGAAADCEGGK